MDSLEITDAQNAGCIFYVRPDKLDIEIIDPLMRPVVQIINSSGILWTAECCQCHPDSDDRHAIFHNYAYMRLICRKEHLGNILFLLAESMNLYDENDEFVHSAWFEYYPTHPKGDWREFIIHMPGTNVYFRNRTIDVLMKFANSLPPKTKE